MWRYHGDVVSLLTYLGFHADAASGPSYEPTASSEWKRRLCCIIYNLDKVIASFTGRPPALGRRYMRTPMPLDLTDEELIADRAARQRAVSALDPDGWRQDGEILPTTVWRSRHSVATFRDEVIELALENRQETSLEHLLYAPRIRSAKKPADRSSETT